MASSRDPIKVGIIGFGGSANIFNLPYILPNPNIEIYAFLQRKGPDDANLGRFGHCTTKYPDAKHYRTTEEFLADPNIALAIITTSTSSHYTLARSALLANKHVLVEKPFCTSTTEADELIALARARSLILTVYQNRRWDSEFRTLRHLVSPAVNALGELTDVTIHYDIPSPPWIRGWTEREYRAGEGMLFGLGSHSIDQALLLLGRPARVTGWIRALREGVPGDKGDGRASEVDDTFVVVLEYEGRPAVVTVKTTVVSVWRDPLKYVVRGGEGSFVMWGEFVQDRQTNEGKGAAEEGFGVEEERLWGELTTKKEVEGARQERDERSGLWVGRYPTIPGYWRGLYENVVGAIRGEVELEVKPEQSRDGIRVMELARQSWKEGKAVPWS